MDAGIAAAGESGPRAVKFREPGDVVDLLNAEEFAHGFQHRAAAPLRAHDDLLQVQAFPDSPAVHFLGEEQSHGSGTAEDRCLQVLEKRDLHVQVARPDRYGHGPVFFAGNLKAHPGSPETVAHRDLDPVIPGHPGHLITARKHVLPVIQVFARIGEDLPFPRGARGSVNPHDIPEGNRLQREGIAVGQILCRGEGKPQQIPQ